MKEIKLTDEQLKNARREWNRIKKLPILVSAIIEDLQDNMLEKEEEFWNELATMHKYKNLEEVLQDNRSLQISWIKGSIELLTKEEAKEIADKRKKRWPSGE